MNAIAEHPIGFILIVVAGIGYVCWTSIVNGATRIIVDIAKAVLFFLTIPFLTAWFITNQTGGGEYAFISVMAVVFVVELPFIFR